MTESPTIRQTKHKLISDIVIMPLCSPQKYRIYLADNRSIDMAYIMDNNGMVIRQK